MGVALVIGLPLAFIAAIVWIVVSIRSHNYQAILDQGFQETDRIRKGTSTILFDDVNKKLALLSPATSAVVPYANVREWSYQSRRHSNGNLAGWVVRITTSDPRNPLYNIPMTAVPVDVPEFWIAKISAHVNG